MPARQRSATITDRYRRQLVGVRDTAVTAIAAGWSAVDLEALDATYRDFMTGANAVLTLGQAQAVTLTDGYFSTFMSSETGELVLPQGLDPTVYAGTTRDGRPLANVLALGLISVRMALATGASDFQALGQGLARVVRAGRTEIMEAGRRALGDSMRAEERVSRWRRVVESSNPCGACLALDGSERSTDADLEIHASCSCTAEPVVDGLEDSFPRITGEERFDAMSSDEQDALFDGRGGADKADLLRSGTVTLDDLVSRQNHPDWATEIFETSLTDLTH